MTPEPSRSRAADLADLAEIPEHAACREHLERITDFMDVALDPETERSFIAHLAECEGCERYLDQIQRTVRLLGGLGGGP